MHSDHAFGVDPDDSIEHCLIVRVSEPCRLAERVRAKINDPATYTVPLVDDWCAGVLPQRPSGQSREAFVANMRRSVKVIVCYEAAFGRSDPRGVFCDLTPQQLEDTFESYQDAMGIWVEDSATLDAAAWSALVEEIPTMPKLRRFELHGARVPDSVLVAKLLNEVSCSATLRGLSLGVDWTGVVYPHYGPECFAEVTSLAMAGCATSTLVEAGDWLWRFPKLRVFKVGATAGEDIPLALEGIKRGLLEGVRLHGFHSLTTFETIVLFEPPGSRVSAPTERCAIVDPARKCVLQLRPEDYALARRSAGDQPPYRVTQTDKWTGACITSGLFHALRHRQQMRHLALHCFLYREEALRARGGTEGDRRDQALTLLLRRTLRLPPEVWRHILELWLGGRILFSIPPECHDPPLNGVGPSKKRKRDGEQAQRQKRSREGTAGSGTPVLGD